MRNPEDSPKRGEARFVRTLVSIRQGLSPTTAVEITPQAVKVTDLLVALLNTLADSPLTRCVPSGMSHWNALRPKFTVGFGEVRSSGQKPGLRRCAPDDPERLIGSQICCDAQRTS